MLGFMIFFEAMGRSASRSREGSGKGEKGDSKRDLALGISGFQWISYDFMVVLWCFMVFYDRFMVFYGVLWCFIGDSMVINDDLMVI